MSRKYTKFYINLDKLIYNIKQESFEFTDNSDFKFLIDTTAKKNNYKEFLYVTFQDNNFGYFQLYHRDNAHYHKFSLDNTALYRKDFNIVLEQLFNYLNILDFSESKMEIAINTNRAINLEWYDYEKKDTTSKLKIKKRYYTHSRVECKDRAKDINKHYDSIYIKKRNSGIEMRLENKSNEIIVKKQRMETDKTYILDAYKPFLDTSKDVYRLEMTLDFNIIRRTQSTQRYSLRTNPLVVISAKQFKKLSKFKQNQFVRVTAKLSAVSFASLTDESFLYSLFCEFSVFKHKLLLGNCKPQLFPIFNLTVIAPEFDENIAGSGSRLKKIISKKDKLDKEIGDRENFKQFDIFDNLEAMTINDIFDSNNINACIMPNQGDTNESECLINDPQRDK